MYCICLVVPPSTPTNVSASSATPDSVTLSWDASTSDGEAGITSYVIEFRATSGASDFEQLTILDGTSTTYTTSNLSDDTEYEFVVKALNDSGYSEASTSATIKTPMKIGR